MLCCAAVLVLGVGDGRGGKHRRGGSEWRSNHTTQPYARAGDESCGRKALLASQAVLILFKNAAAHKALKTAYFPVE